MLDKVSNPSELTKEERLLAITPNRLSSLPEDQSTIPKLARDKKLLQLVEQTVASVPTSHEFHLADARKFDGITAKTAHLIVTSPPYWTLKKYNDGEKQMGAIADYEDFVEQLDHVWRHCFDALVPGGRVVIVVGDVCLSRRQNKGRHTVVPLHASIQESCRKVGFDNLAPIIWHKIANAKFEAGGTSTFLGKPYEPNAVIKNDIEYILMQRKPGGYRSPSFIERVLSVVPQDEHRAWFQQIWTGVTGASTKQHPAPYPIELASRLIRMFSFVGDTVFDPFLGSGTTAIASALNGRNSVGCEIDNDYLDLAATRFEKETNSLLSEHHLDVYR